MAERNLPRDRKFLTFRIFPEEKALLQRLGQPKDERYVALCKLVDIVPELDLQDVRGRKRKPLRLGIPVALDAAIRQKCEETGQPYVGVLLAAATEYRRRNPL